MALNRLDLSSFTDEAMASRIGSAVRLDDIPAKYKKLPVLGRGATSIALDEGNTVLLLTRDTMKLEWLRSINIAYVLEHFNSGSHIQGMRELPIYVVRVPKLFKLDTANRRVAMKAVKEFNTLHWSLISKDRYVNGKNAKKQKKEESFRALAKHFTEDEDHVLAPLFSFLSDYDVDDYNFDLGIRNFMQESKGKLIVSDPIVLSEIITLISEDKKNKYDQKARNQRGG